VTPPISAKPTPQLSEAATTGAVGCYQGWKAFGRGGVRMCIPSDWRAPRPGEGGQPPSYFNFNTAEIREAGEPIPDPELYACRSSAGHHLKPYGTDPTITRLRVDGYPACVVLPSDDASEGKLAELNVRSEPTSHGVTRIWVMYANADFILRIARTIRFPR
jgi:hypothetical protein